MVLSRPTNTTMLLIENSKKVTCVSKEIFGSPTISVSYHLWLSRYPLYHHFCPIPVSTQSATIGTHVNIVAVLRLPPLSLACELRVCEVALFNTFRRVHGRPPAVKVVGLLTGLENALIFLFYYLSLKTFTRSEKPATRSAGLRVFPSTWVYRKIKSEIKDINVENHFRAGVCPFHNWSCQSHHPNYLKVSKIYPTPLTRNLHARLSGGQPLTFLKSSYKYKANRKHFIFSVD